VLVGVIPDVVIIPSDTSRNMQDNPCRIGHWMYNLDIGRRKNTVFYERVKV
jgi:hypothetical protein